jgi:hypothetical protein
MKPHSNVRPLCGRLFIEVSRKLVRGDSRDLGRCRFRKRREQRGNRRFDFTHSREDFVVLGYAKPGSFRIAGPRRVRCGSRYATKHID